MQVGHIRRTVEEKGSHNPEEGAHHNPEEAPRNLAGNHHIDRGEDFAGI